MKRQALEDGLFLAKVAEQLFEHIGIAAVRRCLAAYEVKHFTILEAVIGDPVDTLRFVEIDSNDPSSDNFWLQEGDAFSGRGDIIKGLPCER